MKTFAAWMWCLCLSHSLFAADPTAFRGGTIMTATGELYARGTLVIEDGKIVDVGWMDEVEIPVDALIHDCKGKVIIPGLVDTHSHLGVYSRPTVKGNADGNEATDPVQAILRALDSLNPFDPGFKMALAGGITTGNIMPGSANAIGGQTIYVKYRGYSPEQMWIGPGDVLGGLKMANGENPKRTYGSKKRAPATRMKLAALQRSAFIDAQNYMKKWEAYRAKLATGEEVEAPEVNLELEPLVEVLTRRRTVHFHTHRADDILTVLRLKAEFGFDLVIQHGTEGYKVAEQIAAANVPVSLTIVDSPGGKAEVVDFIEECGARLTEAGVKVIINTDDPITESRLFLRTAATAYRGGMTEEQTLRAVTIHAAQALQLDARIGSLEKGKDADFVVLSGRPFSAYTKVLQTWIDGKLEFDLENDDHRRYQTGGFALYDKTRLKDYKDEVEPESVQNGPLIEGAPEVTAEDSEFYVVCGRLYSVASEPIDDGLVHVKKGRIEYAGPRADFEIQAGIPVISAAAITPGLIDAHSVVPLSGEYNIQADQDQDEVSDPNQADLRVLDGFHPGEGLLRFLLQNGVTVVHACPGRANVIAGLSGVFRTYGQDVDNMTIKFPQAMVINLGNDPKLTYEGSPATRMGTAAILRNALSKAATYARKRTKAEQDGEPFERNLKDEHLALTLKGKLPILFCAQRADDILTASRIAKEFRVKPMIALGAEAYLVREDLAKSKIPVIAHPTMQRLGGLETMNTTFTNAAMLVDEGVQTAIGSGVEGYVPKSRVVRFEASIAMLHGLKHAGALHAVTLGPAKILGIARNYGSLEKGKVADIVLYDGDPLEHTTKVETVIVGGTVVFHRANEPEIPFANLWQFVTPEVPCCNF